jgi:hypothetical protein
MDDNSVEEILSELGGHQGCPAATLLHVFGTHQPLKKVQAKMTKPGEFLASYSDNTSGRGTHKNCIEALKTMQKIGPAYGIQLGTTKVLLGSSGGPDNSSIRRQHYLDLGVKAEDIITHPDDIPPPISRLGRERALADLDRLRAQRATKYGFQLLGIPLGLPEFISKSVKDKFSGLYAQWKPVIKFKDTQSAWLMYSMCLSRSINHMCRQIPTVYIMEHASIFDDTLRRGIREILSTKISDLEWARLKLPLDFDIYNTAKSGFVASYQEYFKHTAIHFPVINDLIHSNAQVDRRLTLTMKCFNEERTQLICLAKELSMPTHSPDVERERSHETPTLLQSDSYQAAA